MQPLNPFLSAFAKSPYLAQCSPPQQHILLVPTTDVILDSRDTETGAPLSASVASDEFIGSHVLRILPPKGGPGAGAKEPTQNLREMKGKPKLYSTINGRTIVIKDNYVYSNKGFRALAQANLLHDALWYPDTLELKQFLVYFISRPLVGSWEEVNIPPALLPPEPTTRPKPIAAASDAPKKKDIRSFHELLNHFPAIARQMQNGLEKLFREFTLVVERPLPPPPSASVIPDPEPINGPITHAVRSVRSNSTGSISFTRNTHGDHLTESIYSQDDEDIMRVALETAVTSAIDLFQNVDKQQLSLLGATTDLTGPVVERMIERYLGIAMDGGSRAKRDLISRLGRAVDEFRKMTNASCPQEMMEILLSTAKAATQLALPEPPQTPGPASEKPILTINADTLVSLLLYVVIKARIKHLQARLSYVRHFIFIDDVDSGEIGYALSTFEAVLAYLDRDSGGLRRASRRNRALWDAVSKGDIVELKKIMEPETYSSDDAYYAVEPRPSSRRASGNEWNFANGGSSLSSTAFSVSERFSEGSGLSHVFPFQDGASDDIDIDPYEAEPLPLPKKVKRVSMDTRSMSLSSSSEISFRSRTASITTTWTGGVEGDTSIERLAQTTDALGESVPMMAIQNGRVEVLEYLLSLSQYFPAHVLLEDQNNAGTTLMSAAVQLGEAKVINMLLNLFLESTPRDQLRDYLARQDTWGRSAAHYLFHAPFLIKLIGEMLPWRQKDKNGQTPLFALCRSYDHANYSVMVEEGLDFATRTQGDGQPLHLDEHVDVKGNTLLHIINDPKLALQILQHCDVDVNATNEKRFTPLMLASKYGRFDMVRVLFGDPRVDVAARELRGLTAVELAKDDEVRNKIDDLTLFSLIPGSDSRTTGVVRSYFVEDTSIRFVLKSGAPVDRYSYAVTTCRRSLTDFEHLVKLLEIENPSSWIPSLADVRSPTQILSRPSRAVLKDLQIRMDWFLRVLLAHPTFATHEMLWEFFLVPDLQLDMMAERSRLKAEALTEKIHDEMEPVIDLREVEQFVDHARDIVRSVHFSTRSVARRANVVGNVAMAILRALAKPPRTIAKIVSIRREAERNYNSLNRSSRWPLGLLDETRQRMNEEREEKVKNAEREAEMLGKELRYAQQTVAGELAGWRDMHEKMGRRAIRELARGMLILERGRMEGLKRALRKVKAVEAGGLTGLRDSAVDRNSVGSQLTNGGTAADGAVSYLAAPLGSAAGVFYFNFVSFFLFFVWFRHSRQ
ncbi:hypothetical protein NEUTE1DRAFT_89347 [Neurospora tetrasperma FGSC 2508]|uniref:VPS9 domain-containing protein n=1 Tax=Neurospora tetrasperma (strain FGSC 2508 / ATCC MYA-4615 / P0657) TaxID=510951 RepID=F8N2Y9_NEUT8|nr:uncharacterized protein NEUTE1DRAFT_89347 [Neurospora tetrasperma FGSC 2508]EGO51703.1 hypothetical protein NEUTE1DRAFT_89347 [Neurospora tetrasperma FGSC 2508]